MITKNLGLWDGKNVVRPVPSFKSAGIRGLFLNNFIALYQKICKSIIIGGPFNNNTDLLQLYCSNKMALYSISMIFKILVS